MTHATDPELWTEYSFESTNEVRLDIEELHLRIVRRGNDLLLAERRDLSEAAEASAGPDNEADFKRFAFEHSIRAVHLLPKTPDRPVVVRPRQPLILAPGARVDFYVSFPVDLLLEADSKGQREFLARLRSEILSDTWFGDPLAGVLCYSLKSRARRERPESSAATGARAVCKIHIFNKSKEQLDCAKFCLRLEHCHLWQSGGELWTSPIDIRFNGAEHLSAIDYSEKAPPELKQPKLIMKATAPPPGGLIRRTFARTGIANAFS